MLLDLLISLGWGTVSLTRERAEIMVDLLIKRGEISREEAKKTINELVDRGEKERAEVKQYLQEEVKNMLQKYSLVTREEFNILQDQINMLEQKLKQSDNTGANN